MRLWATPNSLLHRRRRHRCSLDFSSIARDLSVADEIVAVLHTFPSAGAANRPLAFLAPVLSPHIVSTVLSDPSLPLPTAFLFFAWSSRIKGLRSRLAHDLIVSKLRLSPDSAWAPLADLRDSGLAVVPDAFATVISAYAARSLCLAVDAFQRMPDFRCRPNTFTYNTLMKALVDAGFTTLASSLYTTMIKSDCRPNRATYTVLIQAFCKSGRTSHAQQMLEEMQQLGIPTNTTICTIFLSSLCLANRLDDAHKLFTSMKTNGPKPDSATYNALLDGFCRAGRVEEGLQCLKSFESEGFVLGLNGYSCLIDGLFRIGCFDRACEYFNKVLKEKDIKPDCVLYTIMIKGHCELGYFSKALDFLRKMQDRGLTPDAFCYNTLITGACNSGMLEKARSLLSEMTKKNLVPDTTTYTIMICGLCKAGLVHEAQKTFDGMLKAGHIPTVISFNALINGLCKSGLMEEARVLFYRMEMGWKPLLFLRLSQGIEQIQDSRSLQKLVDDMCQRGTFVKAYKLLQDIIDSGSVPDVVTYNILINGFCKVGNLDAALKLFKELHLKGLSPDEVTYGTLIDGLLRVHREEESHMVIQHMITSGFSPSLSIYNTLMRKYCDEKKVVQAVVIWLKHLSQETSASEDRETIQVACRNFEEGNIEATVKALIELDHKHGALHHTPYTIWLIGYCHAQKVDKATQIFDILKKFDIDATPQSCVVLISSLCKDGKLASALDVMLYTLEKGFMLMQHVGNMLLRELCILNLKKDAQVLAHKMHLSGYNMELYLLEETKTLLQITSFK